MCAALSLPPVACGVFLLWAGSLPLLAEPLTTSTAGDATQPVLILESRPDPQLFCRSWMLEAIAGEGVHEQPAGHALGHLRRSHPVGSTFLEIRQDGTFRLLRGSGRLHTGTWREGDRQLILELSANISEGGPQFTYSLLVAQKDHLRVGIALGSRESGVALHFVPAPFPAE